MRDVGDVPSVWAVCHQVVPVVEDSIAFHFPQDTGVLVFNGVGVGVYSAVVKVSGEFVWVEVDVGEEVDWREVG